MAFIDVFTFLEDQQEPLRKRLKFADNVFNSSELPIQHREAVLLKWLGKATKNNEREAWDLLLKWLKSSQMQNLSRNDISQDDVKTLMNVLTRRIKNNNHVDIIIDCATAIIENGNFQSFYKYDMKGYCDFISKILYKIDNEEELYKFIKNEILFNRSLMLDAREEFYKYFLEDTLMCFAYIAEKFSNNQEIFQQIIKVVEKCLFHRNYKDFLEFLKSQTEDENLEKDEKKGTREISQNLPRFLIATLRSLGDQSNLRYLYKIVFHSYCLSYSNDFQMIYKFFVLILQNLGFDMAGYYNLSKLEQYNNPDMELDKSILILNELCEILTKHTTVNINSKLNETTFSDLIKNLTLTVIILNKNPNGSVYKFLESIIVLDPLIVEKILNELLVYIMLSDKTNTKVQYEKFLVSLFEIFSKLHRVPNLISKMVPTLKTALEGDLVTPACPLSYYGGVNFDKIRSVNHLVQDVLPVEVLNYFTQCVTTLPSWQVMNLFKTLLFHLESAIVEKDLLNIAASKIIYVEVIGVLICQFLGSVRIAELTVPTVMVQKFVKAMDKLKEILLKFGTALLKIEHNPALMSTYLNICYYWGELYVMLAFYSINEEVTLPKTPDSDCDSSACNLTYLHPYLSRDQWSLISQRVVNFGEKPCKQIMQKLYIQKLKTLLLFEETVSEEIISSIRTNILSSIDDNWKDLIFYPLVLDEIVSKSTSLFHIAELVLRDVIETRNYNQLCMLLDSKELMSAILYMCLYGLNKTFTRKQKRGQVHPTRISISSKIFPYITKELFLNRDLDLQKTLTDVFLKEIKIEADNLEIKREIIAVVNEKDLANHMDVIERIPVVQFDNQNVQKILIMHLICIYLDLQCSIIQNGDLITQNERLLIGLIQSCNTSLKFLLTSFDTMKLIINKFSRGLEIFTLVIQNVLKNEDDLEFLREGIQFLSENLKDNKHLNCLMGIFNALEKHKKSKSSPKNLIMEYQEIWKKLFEFRIEKMNPDAEYLLRAYTLLFKQNVNKNSDVFMEILPKFLGAILSDHSIKGGIPFLTAILRNKSQLKITEDDLIIKAWNYCQDCSDIDEKDLDEYSKLVMLIFEHIPNEQFSEIADDLLRSMVATINCNDIQKFRKELKIWNAILSCNFNPVKMKIWQKILKGLLIEVITTKELEANEDLYLDVIKFEINIVQNLHLVLTSTLIDNILISVAATIQRSFSTSEGFSRNFTSCISLLNNILKFRKSIIMDYLPTYLQQYRVLLNNLCIKSNSDVKLNAYEIQQVSDCAHKLEKLTKNLITCQRPLARVSPYLIADILKQYEEITLFPNVKIHLNNCLYSFIQLCDQHSISYLMTILSTASKEIFKVIYNNYKKYYKFTGKV